MCAVNETVVSSLAAIATANRDMHDITEYIAAFDTIDHSILLNRLHSTFGISGAALQ